MVTKSSVLCIEIELSRYFRLQPINQLGESHRGRQSILPLMLREGISIIMYANCELKLLHARCCQPGEFL